MLTSFVIALSVAISFQTAGISSDALATDIPTQVVDASEKSSVVADDHHSIYTPFVDGFDLPESTLDRIARTA